MADKERLVGSDGKLMLVTLGSTLTGDGVQDLDELNGGTSGDGSGEGWYKIITISDGTSAFATGLAVNDLFWDDGTMVLDSGTSSDDEVQLLGETEMSDVTGFSIEISRNEIDVTPLGSDYTRYRSGKRDMSGSISGITVIDVTNTSGWIVNNFIRTIKQASAGTVTVTSVDDSPIYFKGVVQRDTTSGETEAFFWAQVILLSTKLGAEGEDAQAWDASFRIAADSTEPTFYLREIA